MRSVLLVVIMMAICASDYQRFIESLDVETAVGLYFMFRHSDQLQLLDGIENYRDLSYRMHFLASVDGVYCAIQELKEVEND